MAELRYQIAGAAHQIVDVHLEAGQRVFSETGGMGWTTAKAAPLTEATCHVERGPDLAHPRPPADRMSDRRLGGGRGRVS